MVKKKHLVVKSLLLQYPGFDIPCIFWSFQDLSRAYGEDNDFAGSPYMEIHKRFQLSLTQTKIN